jgi:transcriptional regulator with XRE-family HTH domain
VSTTNPTDFNRSLGRVVRDRRIALGLTQEAVGGHLGVTFQQQQKYELGINRISVETLVIIAKYLDTTPQALIDGVKGKDAFGNQGAGAPEQIGDRMRVEIVRCLARVPVTRQHIVRNVIKALAAEEEARPRTRSPSRTAAKKRDCACNISRVVNT